MSNGYVYSAHSGYPSTQQWQGVAQNQSYSPSSPSSYHHSNSPVSPQGGPYSSNHHYASHPYPSTPNAQPQPGYSNQSYSYASMGHTGGPQDPQRPYGHPTHRMQAQQTDPMYGQYPDPRSRQPPPSSHFQTSAFGHPQAGYSEGQYEDMENRPFQCDLCSLSFNRGHDLKRHRETHRGDKPFMCNGGCGKTFTRKDALKRHQIVKECGTFESDG